MDRLYTYTIDRLNTFSTKVMKATINYLADAGYLSEEQAEELCDSCLIVAKENPWWKEIWRKHFADEKDDENIMTIVMLRRMGSESSDTGSGPGKSD